jgi:hypothetical protein
MQLQSALKSRYDLSSHSPVFPILFEWQPALLDRGGKTRRFTLLPEDHFK